ncbi:MAG: DUF1801 domain-containing protein [Chloroflexi bacterium]|nr:DUF1801 domain-containing protein [Chloroflexota bacterium]
MHKKVNEYFEKQSVEHKQILEQLRELILTTFPGISEDFLWGVPVYDGGRFYLAALKKQVNLGVSIVGLEKEEIALFEGSGKTARHIKVFGLLSKEEQARIIEKLKLVKHKAGLPK